MRILITAGTTREPLDPNLFVSQRGEGLWGFEFANAAATIGHRVTLLASTEHQAVIDPSIRVFEFGSASELRQLLGAHQSGHDVILHAASVTRYRPVEVSDDDIQTSGRITIELEPTPDLAAQIVPTKRDGQRLIVVRIGRLPEGRLPAKGIDAEIWYRPGMKDSRPVWIDAKRRESPGQTDVAGCAAWVIARIAIQPL